MRLRGGEIMGNDYTDPEVLVHIESLLEEAGVNTRRLILENNPLAITMVDLAGDEKLFLSIRFIKTGNDYTLSYDTWLDDDRNIYCFDRVDDAVAKFALLSDKLD